MQRVTTIFRSVHARTLVVARLRLLAGLLLCALLCGWVSAGAQTGPTLPTIGLIVADFNHDGIPDVLSPSTQTGNFTISFGAAPYGSFSSVATLVPYPSGCTFLYAASVAVGDFNGDGIPDIEVPCSGTIYVLLGKGDGTFTNGGTVAGLSVAAIGDFNHDGKLDIVAEGIQGTGAVIAFYAGHGDGTFATAVTTTLNGYFNYGSVVAADLNSDGYPDLAFANFNSGNSNTVLIFGNNQNGTFGTATNGSQVSGPNATITVGAFTSSTDTTILKGNFFGTGLTDLAVVDKGSNPGVFIAQNTSAGGSFSFATPTKTLVTGLTAGAAASFSSAYTDLLVENGTTLSVLTNNGQGTFASTFTGLSIANTSTLFAAADANGDGYADVYTGTTSSTGIALTVNLVSGSATATSQPFSLPAGTDALTATWPGNVNFSGSTASGSQIVNALASTTSVMSSLNPALVGQTITLTASVSATQASTYQPTGMVKFYDGTNLLGTGTLSGGSAQITTSTLSAATHTIIVQYGGDSIFATSTSSPLSQVVNSNIPVITWANPAAITYGTALSATQLNATAANAQGVAVAGTFVYTPAAGTVLNAGTQTLSVTFTPTNLTNYSVVTKMVSIIVNQAMATIAWTPAVTSIVYGTALGSQELNATATGVGGATVAGNFVYTPASGTVLGAGTQILGVVFTPTNANYIGGIGSTSITVTKATPTVAWATPASIAYGIPLSATQLDATATGVTGTTLAGAFVYTPATGAVLTPGTQTLSVTFTPTDLVDYVIPAAKTVSLTITDIALTSFTPSTVTAGAAATTITITGSGIVTNTTAQINGTAIATTYVSPTSLTAVVPAADFTAVGTLAVTLKNPTTGSVSGPVSLSVTAPPLTATYVGPATSTPGSQPTLNLTIPAYPIPITATLTINTTSLLSPAVTDPNVLFANGLTTYTFTIPANTTTIPAIQLQDGTIASTITVPLVLTSGGVNITPTGLNPVVITVPQAVPVATAATLTRSGNQITVTVDGFSNTREIVQANFTFVPVSGATLSTTQITAPVATTFATYFATAASLTAGSSFVYTQVFNVSGDAASIASVQVTLTNSVGVSVTATAQ